MPSSPNPAASFNTQPPEGGWKEISNKEDLLKLFQHTAARRRLVAGIEAVRKALTVSTHSRPKAAGIEKRGIMARLRVSTHSRPKAAGASLKSLAPSGFAAPISLGSQEKREREYNTAFSVIPAFAIS